MSESRKVTVRKPLLQQVLDRMFEALEQSDAFDASAIVGLRELASRNRLSKTAEVQRALRQLPRREQ